MLILVLFGAIAILSGGIFWVGMRGDSTHVPPSKPGIAFVTDPREPAAAAGSAGAGASTWDGGAITKTISDRRVREDLRKRILEGWAAEGTPEQASAAKGGHFLPAPTDEAGGMDPKYIRDVVHADFFPMASKCYDELLARNDAAAGRLEMSFTIVADETHGGIVEDVSVASEGSVADEKMTTCIRESMSTLAFRPPAHGGMVTVRYPVEFSPDEEPARDH
jgi:hypothetical protein